MELERLMKERHTVRKYSDELVSSYLKGRIREKLNQLCINHRIKAFLEEDSISDTLGFIARLRSSNVENVILFKGDHYNVGYVAAEIMILIQSLGLNSWFIGSSINRNILEEDIVAIVVFGYGQTNGKAHRSKKVRQVSDYQPNRFPDWYFKGITASLLAPTALNRQPYYFNYNNGHVQLQVKESEYAEIEAGILSWYFENVSAHKLTYKTSESI